MDPINISQMLAYIYIYIIYQHHGSCGIEDMCGLLMGFYRFTGFCQHTKMIGLFYFLRSCVAEVCRNCPALVWNPGPACGLKVMS